MPNLKPLDRDNRLVILNASGLIFVAANEGGCVQIL